MDLSLNTPAIAGSALTVLSLWMLRHALRNLSKAKQSANWPKVTGRMEKLELWGTRKIEGEMKPVEKLNVTYQYEADGIRHTSHQVAFYTLVYPKTLEFAEGHPEGSELAVHYDPRDPSQSVLIPGPMSGNKRYSEIILALIMLAVSITVATLGALGKIG